MAALHRSVILILALMTVVACAATPTATPAPVPALTLMSFPSELVGQWSLAEEVMNGGTTTPFAKDLWIRISSTVRIAPCDGCNGSISWEDGCHTITTGLILDELGRFEIPRHGIVARSGGPETAIDTETGERKPMACSPDPDADRLEKVLRAVTAYEIREGRLWLHYVGHPPRALVFQ